MRDPVIDSYRRERRAMQVPGYHREDLGTLVRYTPESPSAPGFIVFTELPESALEDEIGRQVAHFSALGCEFEWKVYGSDAPATLRESLRRAGFEEGDAELLMVLDLADFAPPAARAADGIDIRRLLDPAELDGLAAFQEAIWRTSFPWLRAHLVSMWDYTSFFAAWRGDTRVGSGWIEYPQGSRFAEVHGGAVVPELRGQGIYSRLFEARVQDARDRGVRWIAVDAGPMSRPILEAKGFQRLDATWPFTWKGAAAEGSGAPS